MEQAAELFGCRHLLCDHASPENTTRPDVNANRCAVLSLPTGYEARSRAVLPCKPASIYVSRPCTALRPTRGAVVNTVNAAAVWTLA
jgi:hypothetical protein